VRKIDRLLSEYGESHQNHTNKLIHWICVPLIFFSIVGLIWSIPFPFADGLGDTAGKFLNWATILLALTLLYYISLSPSLSIGMIFVIFVFCAAAYWLSQTGIAPLWVICLVIFVLAWIGQFYGHKIEGKKPSFLKDLQFLLIGPAWLMSFIYKKLGIGI
jgi:uncharacterized membrane protein YGL010W